MKTSKALLYTIVVLAFAASIALLLYDATILDYFGLANGPEFWKGWLIGMLVLFALTIVVDNLQIAALSKEIDRKNQVIVDKDKEINEVKIKFFDEVTNRNTENTVGREPMDRPPLRREEAPDIRIVPKSDDSPLR